MDRNHLVFIAAIDQVQDRLSLANLNRPLVEHQVDLLAVGKRLLSQVEVGAWADRPVHRLILALGRHDPYLPLVADHLLVTSMDLLLDAHLLVDHREVLVVFRPMLLSQHPSQHHQQC